MCVHSDRGAGFKAKEFEEYLTIRGKSTSNSTPYHQTRNSQVERTNKTVWKTVQLILTDRKLPQDAWQSIFPKLCALNDHCYVQLRKPHLMKDCLN